MAPRSLLSAGLAALVAALIAVPASAQELRAGAAQSRELAAEQPARRHRAGAVRAAAPATATSSRGRRRATSWPLTCAPLDAYGRAPAGPLRTIPGPADLADLRLVRTARPCCVTPRARGPASNGRWQRVDRGTTVRSAAAVIVDAAARSARRAPAAGRRRARRVRRGIEAEPASTRRVRAPGRADGTIGPRIVLDERRAGSEQRRGAPRSRPAPGGAARCGVDRGRRIGVRARSSLAPSDGATGDARGAASASRRRADAQPTATGLR